MFAEQETKTKESEESDAEVPDGCGTGVADHLEKPHDLVDPSEGPTFAGVNRVCEDEHEVDYESDVDLDSGHRLE